VGFAIPEGLVGAGARFQNTRHNHQPAHNCTRSEEAVQRPVGRDSKEVGFSYRRIARATAESVSQAWRAQPASWAVYSSGAVHIQEIKVETAAPEKDTGTGH
jgi:hypothetical protein